ncbi:MULTISPECIES: hypothetical protein [Phocaeicola]|jgi:hypothetical protein|uniref:hypothetical protein n=1 Tax=Phocaeicola TaxID=909656 RepID=UPI0030C4C393
MESFTNEFLLKIAGLIITLLGIIVPMYKFISEKNLKQRDLRFNTYHLLIKDLVEPDKETGKIMLDRQIATCFELRHFPEYFELTRRILCDLYSQWGQDTRNERILKEIKYTLKYIKIYNYTFFIFLRAFGFDFICKPIVNTLIKSYYNYNSYNDELMNSL